MPNTFLSKDTSRETFGMPRRLREHDLLRAGQRRRRDRVKLPVIRVDAGRPSFRRTCFDANALDANARPANVVRAFNASPI